MLAGCDHVEVLATFLFLGRALVANISLPDTIEAFSLLYLDVDHMIFNANVLRQRLLGEGVILLKRYILPNWYLAYVHFLLCIQSIGVVVDFKLGLTRILFLISGNQVLVFVFLWMTARVRLGRPGLKLQRRYQQLILLQFVNILLVDIVVLRFGLTSLVRIWRPQRSIIHLA